MDYEHEYETPMADEIKSAVDYETYCLAWAETGVDIGELHNALVKKFPDIFFSGVFREGNPAQVIFTGHDCPVSLLEFCGVPATGDPTRITVDAELAIPAINNILTELREGYSWLS